MSNLTQTLVLCVLQVTLFSLVACTMHIVLRGRSPAVRSSFALSALIVICGVSLLAFSPWPNWTGDLWTKSAWPPAETPPRPSSSAAASPASDLSRIENPPRNFADLESAWTAAWKGFRESLEARQTVTQPETSSISVSTILWALFAAGLAIGLARLIGGWVAVSRMRHRSRKLTESALREQLEVLQAELGCTRSIELRESIRLATAATVGWRKPMILLPSGWRDWNPTELRVVLAHEIAHIHHRDYAAWLFAQISVVLHFYHPLVHWLAGRLRLDQELAADAAAAPLAGGRQTYLETLAQLALRHADRRLSWPVRAFLPTRQTFLRRLEMLRDPRQLSTRSPARTRWLSFGAMLLAGLFIAGLRGPSPRSALAADTPSATPAGGNEPLALAYIPRDAMAVFGVRIAKLFSNPILKPVLDKLLSARQDQQPLAVDFDQIEQVTGTLLLRTGGPGGRAEPDGPVVIIRTKADGQALQLAKKLSPDASPGVFDGQPILVGPNGQGAYATPDERTLIVAQNEPSLRRILIAGGESSGSKAIQKSWSTVAANDVAVAIDVTIIRPELNREPAPTPFLPFAPLWERTNAAAFGLHFDKEITIQGLAETASDGDAKMVRDTLSAVLTLGRNSLSAMRASASRMPADQSAVMLRLADVGEDLLENTDVTSEGAQVRLQAKGNAPQAVKLAATLLPAVSSARDAARKAQDTNNMRQIMLALHNYHDVYNHFPPAVITDQNGKPLYSWRVAILPFVDQARDWNQLKQDEPWDSAHNKKVLAKMPAVFRSPQDPADSNNSSYFVLTGPGTLFESPTGAKMPEILDGTSNTIAIVEAKRDINWARPEDISYDPAKPLPELGGRYDGEFLTGFGDGSVRAIKKSNAENILRALITRSGGEVIPQID